MPDYSKMSNEELMSTIKGNSQPIDYSKMSDEDLLQNIGSNEHDSEDSNEFSGLGKQDTRNNQNNTVKLSPVDKAINMAGQFGKSIYNNPIAHPVLKALSDVSGSDADKIYSNLPAPQGILENVASGAGAAVPLILATTPIGRGVDIALNGISEGTSPIPVISKITSYLKDSKIAKAGITGYGYGASEAIAKNAQGDNVDVNQYAKNTAGQFMLWGALTRGGATLAGKLLPNDLPMVSKIASYMPDSLKKVYTPEGLGSIAGGMVAGAMNAPDQQKGIAGAIVGGALSAMNPSEQFKFKQGMGKTMGFNGISAITDHWSKGTAEANDVFEKEGFDNVAAAALHTETKIDADGNQKKLSVPQQVFDNHISGINEVKKDLSNQFEQALVNNENIKPKSINSFLSILRQRVNSIQDPQSPVSRNFNRTYNSLLGFQPTTTQTEIIGNKDNPTMVPNSGMTSEELTRSLPPKLREEYLRQLGKNSNNDVLPIKLNGLHQLKISMQDMVGPDAYAGERAWTSEERDAAGIANQISNYIGKQNESYSNINKEYSKFKKIEGSSYILDSNKLAQNKFNMDETHRNQRDYELDKISNYLNSRGKGNYDSRKLLDKYYAYQTYNNPSEQAMNKTLPIRLILSGLLGAGTQSTGLPGGFLLGSLASWHLGNPQAWLPVIRGASISKGMKTKGESLAIQ